MTNVPSDPRQREAYDLALRIGLAWRELRRGAAMSRLREFLYGPGEDSIDMGQIDTLDLLAQQTSWRMSDLAEALRVDPSTATRAVQRLVGSGLAERQSSADDGRVVQVQITPAGQARVDTVARRRSELFTHLMGAYRAEELPVFAEMLERFVGAIDSFVVALETEA